MGLGGDGGAGRGGAGRGGASAAGSAGWKIAAVTGRGTGAAREGVAWEVEATAASALVGASVSAIARATFSVLSAMA